MTPQQRIQIFLAHASEDKKEVRKLYERLNGTLTIFLIPLKFDDCRVPDLYEIRFSKPTLSRDN